MNGISEIKHLNVHFENCIMDYLCNYAKEHPEWMSNLAKPKKNIIDCVNYLMQEASKTKEGNMAVLSDADAYALAVKYYEDDTILVKPVKNAVATNDAKKASKLAKKNNEEQKIIEFDDSDDADVKVTVTAEVEKKNKPVMQVVTPDLFDDDL